MYTSHLEASTAEAGVPNANEHPGAPIGSRAFGDPFVHYITDELVEKNLIRFWFSEEIENAVIAVDYEVLVPKISWLENAQLEPTLDVIWKLITLVFFQEYTKDYYRDKASRLSFQQIGKPTAFEVQYPTQRMSKHEIA
jgi:hypothetical protein